MIEASFHHWESSPPSSGIMRLEIKWANEIYGVIPGAVGNHAGIARVIFFNFEDDFHQVRTDICDLGENAAGNAQRRGAQGLTNREADEARACVFTRNEQQDEEHNDQ